MNREAILVLGMHRSGTSAVTGLLVRLGIRQPRTLMAPDAANPEGYWESAAFHDFHERLLARAGSRWDGFTRLGVDALQSGIATDLGDECRRLLHAEFGDAPRFVLKDPRMCRFVPFWLRVLKHDSITPAAVLVCRRPLEVAGSLEARDGFGPERSLLVWLRHVLDAEFDTRSIRRTFVRYEDVLRDWKAVARQISVDLGGTALTWSPTDETEIERFVNPEHRHHRADGNAPNVPEVLADWVRRAWHALEGLQERDPTQTTRALQTLDGVRQEFDRMTAVFGGVAESPHPELVKRAASLEAQVLRLLEHAAGLEVFRQNLERQIQNLEQRADSLQLELSAARHDAQALRDSMSWRITAPLRAVVRRFR